jgi:hypothetical protein
MTAMATRIPTTDDEIRPLKPLNTQKNHGGDMTMIFITRPQTVKRLTNPEQHLIQGLNIESFAEIFFPLPAWISMPEYSGLMSHSEDDDTNWANFSINLSMYDKPLAESDWVEQWFIMNGRVHPYVLVWENQLDDNGDLYDYTISAILVRDQGYQP